MPLILFFYGLFARQYVVFDVCIFKKQKKDYYICVLSVPLSGSFDWTCLSDAIFRLGFFLLCSWSWWPTWKHCLLLWRVTSIFEYYTHSLSDNYKWTQLGQLIICKLLLESPRNFVTCLTNFFKLMISLQLTDYGFLFVFLIPEMQETLIKTNLDPMFNIICGYKLYTED